MMNDLLEQRARYCRADPWIACGLVLLVYGLVLTTPFSVVDDRVMLRDNPNLVHPTWAEFWKQLTTPQYSIYAPLTYGLWYVVGIATTNGQTVPAWGFKLLSWLVHGGTVFCTWWVMWRLFRQRKSAMIGALTVGLHPLQVESVAWTTGTKDLLCGMLMSGALALYLQYLTEQKRRSLRLAVLLGVLATAAKPTAVVLPGILLVTDLCVRQVSWQKRLSDLWSFFPACLIGILIILNIQHATNTSAQPLGVRILIALDSYSFYLQKVFWPYPLLVDYGRTPEWVRQSGQLLWAWVIPLGILMLLVILRQPLLWLAAGWFVIPILPVSGIIPFDMQQYSTVTDHYVYTSMLGVGLMLALIIRCFPHTRWVAIALISLWSCLSVWQISRWQELDTLYADSAYYIPQGILSKASQATLAMDRQDWTQAEQILRQVILIRPRTDAYQNLATVLIHQNRLEEASEMAKKSLENATNLLSVSQARIWLDLAKRVNDADLALAAASHWLKLEPHNPAPRKLIDLIRRAKDDPSTRSSATQPSDPSRPPLQPLDSEG